MCYASLSVVLEEEGFFKYLMSMATEDRGHARVVRCDKLDQIGSVIIQHIKIANRNMSRNPDLFALNPNTIR